MKKKLILIAVIFRFAILHGSVLASGLGDSSLPASSFLHYNRARVNTVLSMPDKSNTDPALGKKFFFSAVLTPDFTPTIPPVSLYFERGIAQFTSLGLNLGFSYNHYKTSDDDRDATVLIGVRACGYILPGISVLGKQQVTSYGFDPYIGLTYNYYITASTFSNASNYTSTASQFGLVAGTRWYPGNKRGFGILAEYGTTGITGSGIRFGVTLGR